MKTYRQEDLVKIGFKHETFAFATGGGEDEGDMDIYVKDDIAVRIEFDRNTYPFGWAFWCKYDNISYMVGWDYNHENLF